MPICTEMVQLVPTKAVLQPVETAHICTACHDYADQPPPMLLVLLVQNLSSKRIAPTDNMQPSQTTPKRVIGG